MTEPNLPPDDSTRFLGTPFVRSGDQGLFVRGIGQAVVWLLHGLRRGVMLLIRRSD